VRHRRENPGGRRLHAGARRVVLLVADVSHVDAAELGVVLRRSRESPVAGGGEQARHRQTRPVEADAEDQGGDERAVHQHELSLGTGEEQRARERRMDGGSSRRVHQKVAPAQPTAVMKLSAPSASAPPNATPKSLRAPEPCSVKANTSPVTMTATVMRTCATVPLRLARIIRSGPSHGMGGPIAAAPASPTRIARPARTTTAAAERERTPFLMQIPPSGSW